MDFTLSPGQSFPVGTTVGVYALSDWGTRSPERGVAPPGSSVTTASMAADGADFTGLTSDASYVAGAQVGGTWTYVRFSTPTDQSAETGVEDDSITEPKLAPAVRTKLNAESGLTVEEVQALIDASIGDGSGVNYGEDFGPFAPGKGVLLTSPDGGTVKRVFIDDDGTITAADSDVNDFDPTSVGALLGWWDVSSIEGLSDGGGIASLEDLSVAGRDLVQADAAKRPAYKTGIVNAQPVARFDGVNDFLAFADATTFHSLGTLTVFIVMQRIAHINDARILVVSDGTSLDYVNPNSTIANSLSSTVIGDYAGGQGSSVTHPGNNVPFIYESVYSGTENLVLRDGAAGTPAAHSAAFAIKRFYLAAGFDGASVSGNANIDVAEMLIFSEALDSDGRTEVRDYLADKWGIA